MNTCNTVVQVHGVLQFAKNQDRTHLGNTAGLPVPMLDPAGLQIESALSMWSLYCPDKVYIVYLEST